MQRNLGPLALLSPPIFIIAADDIVIERNRSTTEVDYVSMRRVRRAPQKFQTALIGAPISAELTQV